MFRKTVAVLFVAVWLLLLGIEFSEDSGLFEYDEADMNRSVETTLSSLGEAIKVSDATEWSTSRILTAPFDGVHQLPIQVVSFDWVRRETRSIEESIPIYQANCNFLI